MPQFQTDDSSNLQAGTLSGATGVLGAIPLVNMIAPGIASAWSSQGQQAAIDQMLSNAQALKGPQYSSDEGVKNLYAGNFSPDMYSDPTLASATTAQDSQEGRAAQLAALQQMSGLTDQSATSSSALGRNQAEMDARQLAQSREGAIRQDAMRRGQVGGPADMIARQQAAQAASNQNLNAGLQNAQQAALMRLAGTQAQSGMANQLRGQDQSMSLANANIQNQFNLANTAALNGIKQANTQLSNAANLRNLDSAQAYNNNATNLAMQKLQRNDKISDANYGAQMDKYNAINSGLAARAGMWDTSGQESTKAGQIGFQNFKDFAKMMGGGM